MITSTTLDVRADFPFLTRIVNGKPIVYFDNAATTQKPSCVLRSIQDLYTAGISNVHRAVNFLAAEVTGQFEESRSTIASLLGAHAREVIFVNNTTHAINVVANSLSQGKPLRVLASTLEHHSNLLPWTQRGKLDLIPWNPSQGIDLDVLERELGTHPGLVAITQASNFLGTTQPVREIGALCRKHNVPFFVDASQSIAHEPINVRELGCDYLAFSGHKMYGPGGIGVLYVSDEQIGQLSPLLFGGNMVKEVHAETFVMNDIPHRFEAGTPNIEGVIGLGAAVRFLSAIGYPAIAAHERDLVQYAKRGMRSIPCTELFGPADSHGAPLVSFQIKGLDSGAVAKALAARANVIVRSGFHCAQPAHEELGIGPTVRASFGIYNTLSEIDSMLDVTKSLTRVLR